MMIVFLSNLDNDNKLNETRKFVENEETLVEQEEGYFFVCLKEQD
jgi:hypothetical protein